MDAQAATFDEVERTVGSTLVEQELACGQAARLQVGRQGIPLFRVEGIGETVFGTGLRDGMDQPLQIQSGRGWDNGIHDPDETIRNTRCAQALFTPAYTFSRARGCPIFRCRNWRR